MFLKSNVITLFNWTVHYQRAKGNKREISKQLLNSHMGSIVK